MMQIQIQSELDLIKQTVLKLVRAEAIYLFGSYAYGMPNEKSDYDIYVVVPDDTSDLTELYADIQRALRQYKLISLDLLLGRSRTFNRRKSGPTLERVIAQKGTLLYGD